MNAILLTALALGGANGAAITTVGVGGPSAVASDDCGQCGGRHFGRGHGHGAYASCWGPMPQTCYDPPYGCYPGSRHMNRYPAFHGTYYRRPYNYRNVFDYPWHADLHEPTSYFSYNVTGDAGGGRAASRQPTVQPPQPIPTPVAALPLHQRIEQATAGTPAGRSPQGLRTLRR